MTIYKFLADLAKRDIKLWVEEGRLRCNAPKGVLTADLRAQLQERKAEILAFLQPELAPHLPKIEPVPRRENLPLSFAQQRLWFLEKLAGNRAAYNIPIALQLKGTLQVAVLEKALNHVIKRHEVLRTHFPSIESSPVQVINPHLDLTLPVEESPFPLPPSPFPSIHQEAQTPFDLAQGPLLRVKLLRLAPEKHVLLLTMHHIIADGWSLGILVRELSVLYRAFSNNQPSPLPPLSIQYADFAVWQRQYLQGEVLETQLDYWKQHLKGAPPLLELPTDRPRPSGQSFSGRSAPFSLGKDLTASLRTLSQQAGTTLFATLLAALGILLSRYSQQQDLVIGTPIANRNRQELEPLIGFFANTLALRLNLSGNPRFQKFLEQVKQSTLDAYAHQNLPFERLVEELQPERSLSYSPLFQVMFALQNAPLGDLALPGLSLHELETPSVTTKFDLTVSLRETAAGLAGKWEYSSDLFDAATIRALIGHYQNLLGAIVEHPEERVANLPLLGEAEREQLLLAWQVSEEDAPQCLHQRFEEQVERTPDAVAVVYGEQKLTYRALNARANQLAHYLQTLGVGPDVLVGICVERSMDMVIALLGILKAGGAYLPLEPTYPQEYLQKIVAATEVSMVLSQPGAKVPTPLLIDLDWDKVAQHSQENPANEATPESLACVIYSAQRGIAVAHAAMSDRLCWLQAQLALSQSDVVLQQAALAQEVAVGEIFGPLVTGGRLAIAPDAHPATLQRCIAEQQVSLVHFVPATLSAFLDSIETPLSSLRRVFCSGTLSLKVVEQFERQLSCSLCQLYSFPETGAIICCEVNQHSTHFPPDAAHRSIYVLDEHLQPVPRRVPGEIYGGGQGLAQGYLHNLEETERRLVANPFTPGSRLFKTGVWGRILNNGALELLGSRDRQVWMNGFPVSLEEIEAALLTVRSLHDCRVLVRQADTPSLTAYIVPRGHFSVEQIQAQMRSLLPAPLLPSAYVPLSALPLTATGQINEQALQRLPVIDSELVQRWEEELHSRPEIAQAAVVVQQPIKSISAVHLSDLLEVSLGRGKGERGRGKGEGGNCLKVTGERGREEAKAVSYGGPLPPDVDIPLTLAHALHRAAQSERGIVYIRCDGSEFVSYQELLEEAQRILGGLRKLGLKPQERVIFQLERLQDFIPAFWGCMLGGFVPVPMPIPPTYEQAHSAARKLQNAWQMLAQPLVLAGASAVEQIRSSQSHLNVASIEELRASEPDTRWHSSQPDDLAVLLLTSGSTGVPKAVMQSHRSILSRSAATAVMNRFTSDDVSLNWFPLDHVGGLVMFHLRDVYLGCQQIQAPIQLVLQQPLLWLDWIERYRATITWAPNFAYGMVVAQAEAISHRRWDLSSMRFILNGGEAIAARSARKFLEVLAPHRLAATAMYPAWGMSETCSGVVYSHRFSGDSASDEQHVEVGAPIPGIWVRIADSQQAIAEGTIGRVQVKGLSVTSGYYQNPQLNQAAFTADGWFNTGDLGYMRSGRLTITGREQNVIIINGINYYAHEIEALVEEVAGVEVSYTAAVAVREPQDNTDRLVIFFTPAHFDEVMAASLACRGENDDETKLAKLLKAIRTQVVQNIGINPDLVPVEKDTIPKTSIGKIGRSQLAQRFEAGEFDDLVKQLDLLLENANTLPNWFYQQVWRPKAPCSLPLAPCPSSPTVVFLDSLGLGAHLCDQFKRRNQLYVQVEAGIEFDRLNPQHYRLNPDEPQHYQRLFTSLAADDFSVAQVLHLWTYDEEAEIKLEEGALWGTNSLLFLIQALAHPRIPVRLQVVSSYSQLIESGDRIACQKTPLLGLLKTVAQEMPWITCRHVDLGVEPVESNAALVLQELSDLSGEREVAYRSGQRLVSRLAQADLANQAKQPLPFKKGGMYLLSGGLGGIGVEIARYLLTQYEAKLLLVGRTTLNPAAEPGSERLNAYQSLAQLGNVRYQAVDIGDFRRLQQVVEQTKAEWASELAGVIHLAGVFQERLLEAETPESGAAVLYPKLQGTWALHQLLPEGGVFIGFSSVNGFCGGTGVGAYAAANRFLDSFARHLKYNTALQSYCFAWSMWEEVGMSRGYQFKELTRDRGFSLLSPQQGLHSFLAGLHHNQAQLGIGINGSHPHLRPVVDDSYALQTVTAYVTLQSEGERKQQTTDRNKTSLSPPLLVDRFGTQSGTLVELEEMPLTKAGTIARQMLALGSSNSSGDRTQPQTAVERRIAQIWQEVLQVPSVSLQDNFFELGGHSLLATQVMSRVRAAFGVELPLSSLFASPTVAGLSQQVDSQQELAHQSIQPDSRNGNLPLSFAQQRLWFLSHLEGNSVTYNLPIALHLSGPLNHTALEQALNQIIERHEVLRTRFPLVQGSPVQVIAPHLKLTLPIEESPFPLPLSPFPVPPGQFPLSPFPVPPGQFPLSPFPVPPGQFPPIHQEAQTPFDLENGSLLRVKLVRLAPSEHVLLITMHHIVADGWSLGILVREVSLLYQAFCAGTPSPLPPLPIQYADFALWQRHHLQAELATQLSYWRQQLAGAPPLLELPSDRPRPPVQTFSARSESFTLDKELTAKLQTLSQRSGTSLFMTLVAAFAILLARYSQQSEVVIGSAIANRNRQEIEPLIGFFVNTLALRFDLQNNPRFHQFLEQVRQVTLAAYAHQDLPFEKLVEELQPERNLSHSPIFQVMFVLQNSPLEDLELPGLNWTLLETPRHQTQFDLTLSMREEAEGLKGVWEYNSDLFDATTMSRMSEHYQILLAGMVANPEQPVAQLPLLTSAQHQLLMEWNATETEYPNRCIHQLFEDQVRQTPAAVAVVWQDQQLTYRELNARANQLAHYLQRLGVGPEVLVGICVERSVEMIVGLLGILKAGGAYVPLDPTYPDERLAFLLADTGISVLLTQKRFLKRFEPEKTTRSENQESPFPFPPDPFPGDSQLVCLDTDWEKISQEKEENPPTQATPDNLAYVMYTSGSTGVPKGVQTLHRGVVRLLCGVDYVRLDATVKILHLAPLAFDASTFEIWGALLHGGSCILFAEQTPHQLGNVIKKHGINTLWLTASLFNAVIDENPQALRGLSQLLVGGEALSVPHVRRALTALPATQIINGYGPTESTTFACCYPIPKQLDDAHALPIGRPIANTQAYILDQHLQPLPVGVPGELYLGGDGLARGYLNRPELTTEKFIPNPFSLSPFPLTLYRTGDIVRYLSDGNIEYLGRLDNQVKIRGFRIEPGEIEAVLSQHPQVQQAAVVQENNSRKRLVAYVVGEELSVNTWRSFLQEKLPEYMIPAVFVQLEAMPLTPNGKLDRRALPMSEIRTDELMLPRTSTEATLATIWADVLGLEQIGVSDNFFELGGDSILSIQVVARANEAGLKLSAKQLFQQQTIAELAAVVEPVSSNCQQHIVTGSVPLTPVQHWFFEQQPPNPHHFNQAVLLKVSPDVQPEQWQRIFAHLLEHHDALRLRFEPGPWRQSNAALESAVPFQVQDLSNLSPTEQPAALEAITANIQTSLNLQQGPLMQVVLFHLGEQPARLLWVIHHLAVDGVSWRILLGDLTRAYQQLQRGEPIQLPPKTTAFQEWARQLQESGRSPHLASELDYWLAQTGEELPVDISAPHNPVAESAIVTVSLTEAETRALRQEVPSVYRTQINDVLLTALVLSLADWTGTPALLVNLEGHGREELFEEVDLSRTVGWFTTIFPVRLQLASPTDLGAALKSVKEQLRRVPKRGIGYGLLRYLGEEETQALLKALPTPPVSFNYLGQFEPLNTPPLLGVAPEAIGKVQCPLQQRPHLLEVNSLIAAERLQISWTYGQGHRQATVERLAEDYLKALRSLMAHCQSPEAGGYTPSDFAGANLNQRQLDRFVAKLKKNSKG
ncbi:MAG: amino acid adenylation domain-containing protein [Cyanophyceae cyanobacterium]